MLKMFKSSKRSYEILVAVISIGLTLAIGYHLVRAGNLNPSSAPGDTMKTLDDIYYRLDIAASATSSWGLDSSAATASTMYTLSDIFNKTPDFHGAPGDATEADVNSGNTYYTTSSTRKTGTGTMLSDSSNVDTICYVTENTSGCQSGATTDQLGTDFCASKGYNYDSSWCKTSDSYCNNFDNTSWYANVYACGCIYGHAITICTP